MGALKAIAKFCDRFSCISTCKLTEGDRILYQFKKTITLDELDIIKKIIEDKRNPTHISIHSV